MAKKVATEDLLLVGGGIIALGVVGYAIYSAFFSQTAAPSASQVNLGNPTQLGPGGSTTTLPSINSSNPSVFS
jgi:hypothetical protein